MKLTRRRTEIINRMAGGMTAREIAADLGLCEHTVKRHKEIMYKRLGFTGQSNPGVRLVAWYKGGNP